MTNDPNPQADAGAKLAEAVRAALPHINARLIVENALAEYDAATKPKTVVVNGVEVPEPVREALRIGDRYWLVALDATGLTDVHQWDRDDLDRLWLSRGLIHLTRAAAESHARALIGATAQEKQA